MTKRSKFSDVFDLARGGREAAPVEEPLPALPVEEPAPAPDPQPRKRGRPASGKRSDPAYAQVGAYIRRATYHDVQVALLHETPRREFSELVQTLLEEWLGSLRPLRH